MDNNIKNNSNILSLLFPEHVITEETGNEITFGEIYPEEEIYVSKAVQKRRIDFANGRICAKKALARTGINKFPLTMSKDRSPIWPDNIVGSISHTKGYCGVAIALKKDAKSIGLDIECDNRLSKKCWYLTCTKEELRQIESLPDDMQNTLATLIFSAKECFYKCQYPISKSWSGFHDAILRTDLALEDGKFEIELQNEISANGLKKGDLFDGRYIFKNGFVFSGITLNH